MATPSSAEQKLDEIIECPICREFFVDPRTLPACLHTFCMRCVAGFGADALPGDELPCPLCRADFAVPVGGLALLPTNTFVDSLVAVRHQLLGGNDNDGRGWTVGVGFCDRCSGSNAQNRTGEVFLCIRL